MQQPQTSLEQILNNWAVGHKPTALEYQQLANLELVSQSRAKALGITPVNSLEILQTRAHLFQAVASEVLSFDSGNSISQQAARTRILLSLWNLWLPLAMQLASQRKQLNRPLIQGILGGQGTGKTTLAAILSLILNHLGYCCVGLSLDDLYKTYEERQRLQQQDPRLIWRGPPGTHDLELGKQLLDQLRQPNYQQPIMMPRFDKSAYGGAGDRTTPETVTGVDIVLFEGWFVGVRPIDPAVFDSSTPVPLKTPTDLAFARDMNDQLKSYLPLWERLDKLIILYPTDYRLSLLWRRQAEQQMRATGKSGMADSQVAEFVNYFWQALHPELFITPMTQDPSLVDLVIAINPDHTVAAVYRPSEDQ
ncbi:glycerate kinase [Lyngbya aestuarii]|uniref:glycerate kinase n=1 Tax=Lyngbya aestuarii TaxID=118322 RepID=UPI00403D5E15